MAAVAAFGWTLNLSRTKALPNLSGIDTSRGWLSLIRESFSSAWQRNITIDRNAVMTQSAVFSCMTLIASDIAKLRLRLVERDRHGIWSETTNPAYSPVLRKPNDIQTRIQFWESWLLSKLSNGNSYVLKGRDERGVVVSLHVLDPSRVQPLVSSDGEVFYRLSSDNIVGLESAITVPAREIIHDRMNALWHPLVGLSPICAAAIAATQGLAIQNDAAAFFSNGAMPGGVLTGPGAISDTTARRLKDDWQEKFAGNNAGKIAVLGDGLKYEQMRMLSTDAQLVEQLKWTAETVCSVFHIPPFKLGIGNLPSYANVSALDVSYYSQCLQSLIEAAELALDEGLGIREPLGTEFDLRDLIRMDEQAQVTTVRDAVAAGIMSPNEARFRLNLPPVEGGETPYLQQQNYPLTSLANRPAPAAPAAPAALPAPAGDDDDDDDAKADNTAAGNARLLKAVDGLARRMRTMESRGLHYRGTWTPDATYERGDMVTYAGSMWHAWEDCKSVKPGENGRHWSVAVKRGRDGKNRDGSFPTNGKGKTQQQQEDVAWAAHSGASA